ncbi:MAG: DUF4350 domain-containing protein [Gemmatimonadota bacterium]|nr:DUF4350 domain-containing protein [Gemmatimonadota bacterium]
MKTWQRRILWGAGIATTVLVLSAGLLWWYVSLWVQQADPTFKASVAAPAYHEQGPTVLFDQAHFNAHGLRDTYSPFAALLREDGYRLTESARALSQETLNGQDILVIVNARGSDQSGHRGDPAFALGEVEAVYEWVYAGGSLLFIADHSPFGAAARAMAERFAVAMSNMDTVDPVHHDSVSGKDGFLVFSRQNGLLGSHAILEGRHPAEKIERVLSFNGQSLRGPAEATVLLLLGETASDRAADGTVRPSSGRVQGLAMELGQGRVVVLGEAAMVTAQIMRTPSEKPFLAGMNRADADDKQFTLNVMHWLSRLLN